MTRLLHGLVLACLALALLSGCKTMTPSGYPDMDPHMERGGGGDHGGM